MTKNDTIHGHDCSCYECEDNNYTRDTPDYEGVVRCAFCDIETTADPDRYVEGRGWYCHRCI